MGDFKDKFVAQREALAAHDATIASWLTSGNRESMRFLMQILGTRLPALRLRTRAHCHCKTSTP